MQVFKDNPLPWVVQAAGVLLFVGNLYLASLLFPLTRNIDTLTVKVNAIEELQEAGQPYLIDYIQFKTETAIEFKGLVEDVAEMRADLKDIGKVHGLLLQQ